MSSIIEIDNLSKKYYIQHGDVAKYQTFRDMIMGLFQSDRKNTVEEFYALRGVSLKIEQGSKIGIIGRNGSGKSTLLKILSRITEPSEGRLKIQGRIASLLEVGTGFHPELTGRENIYLNGAILGMSKAEIRRKFDEIVEFAEIAMFLDTPVKRYSSGMYVRLAFAVAAHLECEILIVDEVLAVGDIQFQKKCLGKMSDLSQQQGRTLLFVSHNLAAVKCLCDQCLYLQTGHLKFFGKTEDAINFYAQENIHCRQSYVADLVRNTAHAQWAKFINIHLITPEGYDPVRINSKQSITIRFQIQSDRDTKENITVGLSIMDHTQCVIYSHSLHENKLFALRKGMNTIECKFPPWYLTGGNYHLMCWIYLPMEQSTIDCIENAYYFTVMELDPFNTGFSLMHDQCIYSSQYSWSYLPEETAV